MKTRYHQAPELVEREYPTTLLCRTFSGVIMRRHKANVKAASVREAELYKDLPTTVKHQIGHEFTYQDLRRHMDEHTIPDFYKGTPLPEPLPYSRDDPNTPDTEDRNSQLNTTAGRDDDNTAGEPTDTNELTASDHSTADDEISNDDANDQPSTSRPDTSPSPLNVTDRVLENGNNIILTPANNPPVVSFPIPRRLRPNPKKKVIFDL